MTWSGTDLLVDAAGPDPLVVMVADALLVDLPSDPLTIEFAALGVPGRDGSDGGAVPVEWSPPSAQAVWTVPHNLGRVPQVCVTLPDGESVGCRVRHLDANTVSIEFAAATSGTAHIL